MPARPWLYATQHAQRQAPSSAPWPHSSASV